jgi:ATP-dependent exoDNAse (exonuclease V) beta subunit
MVRGVVDCLVIGSDGRVTVLEFKTGGPHADHELQARSYRSAMSQVFGLRDVEVKILYA